MKGIKFFILFVFLILPKGGYACWWYDDDDDYDIDGGYYLDEDVVITPDDDNDSDWNNNEDSGFDSWDDDYSTEYDDEEDNDYYISSSNSSSMTSGSSYMQTNQDSFQYIKNLRPQWEAQSKKDNCVATNMAYAYGILYNMDVSTGTVFFENEYKELFPNTHKVGAAVSPEDLEDFIKKEFECKIITETKDYKQAISNNHPIFCIISAKSEGLECNHMITVVGYDNKNNKYKYIDSGSGKYNTCTKDAFKGNGYEIINIK